MLPIEPKWHSGKNEMELFSVGPEARFQGNFGTSFHVAFGEVEGVAGKDVGQVLETFLQIVKAIVGEIEAESIRLGILK